tara:strand:+ start:215 stop:478 length:264 start_codon:yes stop_codon:yes gene_type:complete
MVNNKPIDINEDCRFIKDLQDNNKMAIYNLIIAVGQTKLYMKGIKPNRHFKITHLKDYFGMNGGPEVFHNKLVKLQEVVNQARKELK